MHRRRVANGVRSDVPCQQCGRGLAGLGHSVSDNAAQAEARKSIRPDLVVHAEHDIANTAADNRR